MMFVAKKLIFQILKQNIKTMKKIINFLSIRPKVRKFLTSYFQKSLAFDLEYRLRIRAADTTCEYIENNMVGIPLYNKPYDALDHTLKEVKIKGSYCEFGVYKGDSVNHIAKKINQNIHAFDSFEGLPETWLSTHKKGHFGLEKMPHFEKNVIPHKGWFDKTLPQWVKENPENIAFLHVDCDLYSSTKTILTELDSKIVKGTIILFDEYFNYPFWQHHEYKAFQEFVAKNNVQYEYLCYSSNKFGAKVAVRILDRSAN